MKRNALFFSLCCLLALANCASPPPSDNKAPASLEFDRIEADSVDALKIHFKLTAANSHSVPLAIEIAGCAGFLNGVPLGKSAAITGYQPELHIAPGTSLVQNLVLQLRLTELPPASLAAGGGENRAELTLNLRWRYGKAPPASGEIAAATSFPPVRQPEFAITSIAILQAELINTQFRVNLRIDNPNVFPVSLSSFACELYGGGRFWAEGRERNALQIPAQGSAETRLFLSMNFINMPRNLLDEVIAMRLVNYRFAGTAEVSTGVPWLPRFRMTFDKSGEAEVFK